MELSFVYSGNETVGALVVSRLEAAGCTRTDDVAHAEAIITYCTSQTALEDAYFDEQGLDWTRAEQAYGDVAEGFDDLDDDGHDHGHDHGSFGDYPGYGAYSAN